MCIRDRFWFAHLGETHLGTEGEVSHPFTGRNREQFRSSCATNRCPGKPKPSDGGGGGEYRQELPSRPWIHSGPINRRHIHLHLLFQALRQAVPVAAYVVNPPNQVSFFVPSRPPQLLTCVRTVLPPCRSKSAAMPESAEEDTTVAGLVLKGHSRFGTCPGFQTTSGSW